MDINVVTAVLPDIPRVFTAIAEWLAALLCICILKPRISGWKKGVVIAVMLLLQSSFLMCTEGLSDLWWIVCMGIGIFLMFLFIYMCCDITAKDAGYYTAYAFIVAEFAASLEWQMYCYWYGIAGSETVKYVFMLVMYGVTYLIIWYINRHIVSVGERYNIYGREVLISAIIAGFVFFMSNIGFVDMTTPFSGKYSMEIFNIRTIIDFGGLALIYAYHIQWGDMRVRHELDSMRTILHNQYIQYEQSQNTIEIINFKYHDLKHHIIALRAEQDVDKRNEYLDKMEEEIKNYEAQYKTGNKVLDTLLTGKNLYCQQRKISLTCVVDGALFEFMDVMDICSIFGNALDNAIECEKNIKDAEKRMIHVLAYSQKKFLIIRFENYYEGTLQFEENLPITTKKQAEFHGYGLKSLRYTVRKYGGEVDISTRDSWFNLKILIPI